MSLKPLVLRGMVAFVCACFIPLLGAAPNEKANTPCHVELRRSDAGYGLHVDGQPFFIHGVGGTTNLELLKKKGGNSFRVWGVENLDAQLAEANRLGLKVAAGIWLEHAGGGPLKFDYGNPAHLADQFEKARAAILKHKDNPAVLLWGIGNEMEGEKGNDPRIWKHIQDIAAMAKKLDPNHPTMTVIAEIGHERVPSIHKYCPDIDIIGINSYGGIASLATRYRELGGTKPFIITEHGPAGTWEVGRTPWKAPIEVTSTEKADHYRAAWEKTILPEKGKLCLGSYAFLWGNKEEGTATWFGMLLPDGTKLEAVDVVSEMWTGAKSETPCPKMKALTVDRNQVKPGGTIQASLEVMDPKDRPLTVTWVLTEDPARYVTGGFFQKDATVVPDAIFSGDLQGAEIHMPKKVGPYWLYAYVRNDTGGGATAVVSLNVTEAPVPTSIKPKRAPLIVYGDGITSTPFAWSGWMGDHANITLNDKWPENPRSGGTCMRLGFKATTGFAGIAGQNPPNDWGDVPGGVDITGATKLTFWARGEAGGELVTFKMGILGSEKKYPDSASAESPVIKLTTEWKQYTIDLTGKDLRCVKTGFVWAVSAQGKPVVFFVDDVQYE